MDNKRTNLGIAGAFALTAILSACGGGGGSSSGGGGSSSAGGTAAKGIISGALVTGYRADGTEIGHTFTAEDGSYELELNGYKGPVRLVLTPPAAPDVALVTCDASVCRAAGADDEDSDHDGMIRFGERYVLDYELTAVINVDKTAKTVSAHITPLTTLVERRATAGGAVLQPETIEVANRFVRQMFGIEADPALVRPVDLTDPEANVSDARAVRYSVINAAFEELADETRDIATLLDDIARDFGTNAVQEAELKGLYDAMADIADAVGSENPDIGAEVSVATNKARDDLEGAAAPLCDIGVCQFEIVLDGKTANNMAKARALVATARSITLGAVEALDTKLNPLSPDYDENHVFSQIQQLTALNENTGYLTEAFGEVMGVVLSQAFVAVSGKGEPYLDLKAAAGAFFDDDRAMDCSVYADEPMGLSICEAQNTSAREDFVDRFSGTIVHAGTSWSVTNASYEPTAEGEVETPAPIAVNVVLKLPENLQLAAAEHEIGVSGSATSGDGSVTITEAGATVTLMDPLNLDPLNLASEESVTPKKFSAMSLDADAEISDGTDSFSGAFGVQFARSANHANLNPHSELNGLMPKLFALNGTFTDGDTGQELALAITLDVTNAEQYRFLEEGYERNDLTTWVYNDDNTITVTHGLPANRIVVKLIPHSQEWGEGHRDAWVEAQIVSVTGEAWLDGAWMTAVSGDGVWVYDSNDDFCQKWVGEKCYWWDNSLTIDKDIRHAFRNSWIRDILTHIQAYVPGEGVYQAAPAWNDDYEWYGEDILVFPYDVSSGIVTASLDESDLDVDASNRYLKLDFNASLEGHLAPSLPAMTIRLTGKRTGYSTALAGLTLGWNGEQLNISLSSTNPGALTLDDGNGTTMLLTPGEGDVIGHIEKDGTVYGTIRRENGVYLISWLDGGFETIN